MVQKIRKQVQLLLFGSGMPKIISNFLSVFSVELYAKTGGSAMD